MLASSSVNATFGKWSTCEVWNLSCYNHDDKHLTILTLLVGSSSKKLEICRRPKVFWWNIFEKSLLVVNDKLLIIFSFTASANRSSIFHHSSFVWTHKNTSTSRWNHHSVAAELDVSRGRTWRRDKAAAAVLTKRMTSKLIATTAELDTSALWIFFL